MIKFKTKEEGILKINGLLLEGYSVEDLREMFGLKVMVKKGFDPISGMIKSVKQYEMNGKRGSIYSDVWTWREKLIINILK